MAYMPVIATGKPMGFYHDLAHYAVIAPVCVLAVIAVIYNVLVGISTWWMYKNIPWTKKAVNTMSTASIQSEYEEYSAVHQDKDILHTSVWEEIFVVNIKLCRYLFSDIVRLKNHNESYFTLMIHDFVVFMPLAMIFIQTCQFLVCTVVLVIFVDNFLMEVTNTCDSTKDCYQLPNFNMSSLPLDCSEKLGVITNILCFHLKFDPIFALAIAGGFLKLVPKVIISSMLYTYLTLYSTIHSNFTTKYSKILAIAIAEFTLLGSGISILLSATGVNEIKTFLYADGNPIVQTRNFFLIGMYFLLVCTLWCVYPQSKSVVRFEKCNWKKAITVTKWKSIQARKKKLQAARKQDSSSGLSMLLQKFTNN